MDNLQYEQYEYARKRIKQKKRVFFHFILFFIGSIFILVIQNFLEVDVPANWHLWVIIGWAFVFLLHFIRVFITDSFMNKNWEKHQVDKLVSLQQKKIQKLQSDIDKQQQQTSL